MNEYEKRWIEILTLIDKKVKEKEELTVEELKFLYEIDYKIDGFGYEKDSRIQEIKSKRNIKEDLSKIYNVSIEEISTSQDEYKRKPSQYKILYGDLSLDSLTSAEGLELPQIIGGSLGLYSLTSAKGLKLPQSIGGSLNLYSLTSAEGLKLPQSIGGDLWLDHLTSAEGLKLPINFDLRRLFCPNCIKKEIMDNPELYYQNYQSEENETLKR